MKLHFCRFHLCDVFWATLLIAAALGWLIDHRRLAGKYELAEEGWDHSAWLVNQQWKQIAKLEERLKAAEEARANRAPGLRESPP
jgi:hypothetical protein